MTELMAGPAPRCFALVPCAGVGARAGTAGPKQYETIAGRSLVAHTLDALGQVPRLAATLVVLSPDDERFELAAPGRDAERVWVERCGGATRAETVANGLAALRERGAQVHDWVLVHDAARCLVRPEWVDRLIDECMDDEVGGLLALPIADTLKAQGRDTRVAATVDRSGKWAAHAGPGVTDESSAVEALGHEPRLVRGEWENFKLTWPGDFALAERLLATRQPWKAKA
jgi:2-C-methyl-D-erythritol 4-phosphate cytidylyltransferase